MKRSPVTFRRHPQAGWQRWHPTLMYWVDSLLTDASVRSFLAKGMFVRIPWVETWAEPEGPRPG